MAQKTVEEVRLKAENVITKLKAQPNDTKKVINYLHYLDKKCPEIKVQIEETLDYALQALQIMKDYEISIPEEEQQNYLVMELQIKELNTLFEKKKNAHEDIVIQLSEYLQKDVQLLFDEIKEVSYEVNKSSLIDVSDLNEVHVETN